MLDRVDWLAETTSGSGVVRFTKDCRNLRKASDSGRFSLDADGSAGNADTRAESPIIGARLARIMRPRRIAIYADLTMEAG